MSYDKDEAQQDLARRPDLPVVDGIYQHVKGGMYVVKGVGILESLHDLLENAKVPQEVIDTIPERAIVLVQYRSNARGTTWFRPLGKFKQRFSRHVH